MFLIGVRTNFIGLTSELMFKKLPLYIIGEHIAPFFLGLIVIVFIFLMNFMIKAVDKILGKGIELTVILEYIGLNIAWILALAIPMSVLIASLMAYGRLSADNEISSLKAAGVSFTKIIFPGLLLAVGMTIFMIYFNNNVLPEFNHRARMLGTDIYRKRPDLNIEEGYFTNDIPGYSLLVKRKNGDILEDVTIYNDESAQVQTTVTARRGKITIKGNRLIFDLEDGEIHELNMTNREEYRRVDFEYHRFTIPIENMTLERSTSRRRGDREMSAQMMRKRVSDLNGKIGSAYDKIQQYSNNNIEKIFKPVSTIDKNSYAPIELWTPTNREMEKAIGNSLRRVKRTIQLIASESTIINSYGRQQNKFLVEIQKKYSIPFACIVFMLVGAPLGIISKKGGLAVSMSISLGFFLIYWTFLIAGEDLADRGIISPLMAMWSPNILVGAFGIYLSTRSVKQMGAWDADRILGKFRTLFSRSKPIDN